MTKCAVKNCKNHCSIQLKKDGITYHRFPQNEIQREKWRCIIARDKGDEFYKPNASSVICSEHFCDDDMYLTKKGFKRIKRTAVPNIQTSMSSVLDAPSTSKQLDYQPGSNQSSLASDDDDDPGAPDSSNNGQAPVRAKAAEAGRRSGTDEHGCLTFVTRGRRSCTSRSAGAKAN